MTPVQSSAPLLPVNISESPLLSGSSLLPDPLFTTLAGPLPIITIGLYPPASPRVETNRLGASRSRPKSKLLPKLSLPPLTSLAPTSPVTPTSPTSRISPKEVISLLDLLESMENDVATEVQRVRLGIQETRTLVQACRADSAARENPRRRRMEQELR
ncbi:hypothetical protein BD309DRAFT_960774 [Dichomitus squalens]|nr:hypothetical protein BD309DRAFT_960774 [Dichomitus squalens]